MQNKRQVAAIPVRRSVGGTIEVLLVTSRETRRWVVPKGWPWPGVDDHEAAAGEAREEAGVIGIARVLPVGRYTYMKRRPRKTVEVAVDVYILDVDELLEQWPEQEQRTRSWHRPTEAAELVDEPELRTILKTLDVK